MKMKYLRPIIILLVVVFIVTNLSSDKNIIDISNKIKVSNSFQLGRFTIDFDHSKPLLTVYRSKSRDHIVWKSLEGKAFITGKLGEESVDEDHGSFFIKDRNIDFYNHQYIDTIYQSLDSLYILGSLENKSGLKKAQYSFVISLSSDLQVSIFVEIDSLKCNRINLHYYSDPNEYIYGFGEQFTYLNFKGKKVPIFVSEQGIGRGKQPLTFLVDLMANSGGNEFTSYAPIPHYITSNLNSVYLKNTEYSTFDFADKGSAVISLFSNSISGGIISAESPLDIIEEYTKYSGRMKPLSGWSQNGAVIGMQGGTKKVGAIVDSLINHDVPISAVWLQDWVGQRITSFGKQLWWNWELDSDHYPSWDSLVTSLHDRNIKVLTYVNPFLTDASDKSNHQINYYDIAMDSSYFVMDSLGNPFDLDITTFSASLLDLTNPNAREWIKKIIVENMLSLGVDGWMADFGEALPYYSHLYSGDMGNKIHNQFPEIWSDLNKEIVESSNRSEDMIYFCRSGFTRSPGLTSLFWLGDQLTSWDGDDGIKTALTGLISSGLSGYSLNHSDIGGYTAIKSPILNYIRSKELFMRWAELNAFTAFFRTHEGNRPDDNHQAYSDSETMDHFSKMANIFSSLEFYRNKLMQEAFEKGYPLVRHPFIHYPNDENILKLSRQFMLGSDLMICPVLDEEENNVDCYLPKGEWNHLFLDSKYNLINKGKNLKVYAPIGVPAVFYRKNSEYSNFFKKFTNKIHNYGKY